MEQLSVHAEVVLLSPTTDTIVYIPGFASGPDPKAVEPFLVLLTEAGYDVHYVPIARPRCYAPTKGAQSTPPMLMAQGVREYMEANGLRNAKLLGHSMGGVVALIVAHEWPELVSSVVTVNPSSVYAMSLGNLVWRGLCKGVADHWYAYRWPSHQFRGSARLFLAGARQYLGRRPWELRRSLAEVNALTAAQIVALSERLNARGTPTWLMYSEHDLFFAERHVAAALEDTALETVRIPGGVHDLPHHQPELLLAYLYACGFITTPERS